jgi:hypothetical protein
MLALSIRPVFQHAHAPLVCQVSADISFLQKVERLGRWGRVRAYRTHRAWRLCIGHEMGGPMT